METTQPKNTTYNKVANAYGRGLKKLGVKKKVNLEDTHLMYGKKTADAARAYNKGLSGKKLNQFEQILNDSNDEFEQLMETYRQDKVKHLANKGNNINLGAKIDVKVDKYQKNIDWHPSKGVKKLQNDLNKIISENQIPKSEGLLNNISQSQQ